MTYHSLEQLNKLGLQIKADSYPAKTLGRRSYYIGMKFAVVSRSELMMRGNNKLSVIFIPVIYSCTIEAMAVHVITKLSEAPVRILLFLLTMPSMIGLIRSGSWARDGSSVEYSGCALQVVMTSDIIDSKSGLESLSL